MSFLSNDVYRRIVNDPPSYDPNIDSCYGPDLLLDWDRVDHAMGDISGYGWKNTHTTQELRAEDEFYLSKVDKLWMMIHSAGRVWRETSCHVITSLEERLKWLNREPKELEKFFRLSQSEAENLEIILKITSFLERALGNVYLTQNSPAPFLLRDLLHSIELETVLNKVSVRLLNITMGHVLGLNLRNVAWHGFLSEGEISSNIVPFLVSMAATIGRDLANVSIIHRPYRADLEAQASQLDHFFMNVSTLEQKNELIDDCPHVSLRHRPFWRHTFELFDQGFQRDALFLLLPTLEHLLRSIYRQMNKCSCASLKASAKEFYVIMDNILEVNVQEHENRLIECLGSNVFEALRDVFTTQNGPRLRDRISHGEIQTDEIPFRLVAHILGLSLYIADVTGSKKLDNPIGIEPKFHPRAVLKRHLLETAQSLLKWNSEFLEFSVNWSDEERSTVGNDVSNLVENSMKIVTSTQIDTLFGQTPEIDALMTNIALNVHQASQNSMDNVAVRSNLFKNKQMRSRSRKNFLVMLQVLPQFRATLAFLIFTLSQIFSARPSTLKSSHLKILLKFTENVAGMCFLDKNRWLEIKQLSTELIVFMGENPILIKKSLA